MEYISIHVISKKWHMKERKVTSLCRDNRIAEVKKEGNIWLVPSDAIKPIDKQTKEYASNMKTYIEENTTMPYIISGGEKEVIYAYKENITMNQYLLHLHHIEFHHYEHI